MQHGRNTLHLDKAAYGWIQDGLPHGTMMFTIGIYVLSVLPAPMNVAQDHTFHVEPHLKLALALDLEKSSKMIIATSILHIMYFGLVPCN